MSILKYFKREFKRDSCMPNPTGLLSKVVLSEGIKAANEEVSKLSYELSEVISRRM